MKGLGRSVQLALAVVALFSPLTAHGAFEIRWPDARSAAMLNGGFDLTGACRLTAPAGDCGADTLVRCVTLSGGELFGLEQARGWGARVSARARRFALALNVSSLGGELYHEREAGLSATWLAASDVELGIGGRCLEIGASGEAERWTMALDATVTRRVLGRVLVGARCENVTGSEIGGSPVAVISEFAVALALPGISLQTGALMQDGLEATSSLGFEAELSPWMNLRAGASSSPGRFAVGLGIGTSERSRRETGLLHRSAVDVAWQWHPKLGGSSFVSVELRL